MNTPPLRKLFESLVPYPTAAQLARSDGPTRDMRHPDDIVADRHPEPEGGSTTVAAALHLARLFWGAARPSPQTGD